MVAKRFFICAGILFLALAQHVGASDATSPPLHDGVPNSQLAAGPGVVTAIVVRSWGYDSQELIWEHLNQSWNQYGAIPVNINYTLLHFTGPITLQDLLNVGADVVIVSNPAGGHTGWSAGEAAALLSYAQMGHNVVGTYCLLQFSDVDNRALAPIWGLRSDLAYNTVEVAAASSSSILAPSHCLFRAISPPLDTGGFPRVQVPLDGSWDAGDFAGATVVARSLDGRNVVTEYAGNNYRAFYVSYMPEYRGFGLHFESTQLIYNAIVCPQGITPTTTTTWGTLKVRYR